MDKERAKEEIKKIIEKYNKAVEENRVNKYNEEMTKKDFILPLFRALGWDVENSNEVTAEEHVSKGRVDYSFRIKGIPKFFLEAKALKEDLENRKFLEQAINYAWHKGCTWAVLTDFEGLKIINSEIKESNPLQSIFISLNASNYLDRFDQLWLLSRESFEQGLLDKEAEKWGKKTKKISVDKQLLADFTKFREILSKDITKINTTKNITEEDLDEAIQRILDRLIFIRNCEDRGLEEKTLLSGMREWESKGKGQLIKSLREVFEYFDKDYNSKIFAKHLCDQIEVSSDVLHEIIEGMYYTKDRSVSYDFSLIEADVLGNIYEQYLGHILKKGEKRAKLTESHAHRKEQGIYYTPTYIVNYIVKNTVGELLKDKKVDVSKIRILDPACGSGSFLIKAFDTMLDYHVKKDKGTSQVKIDTTGQGATFSKKAEILKNDIFGVDLDKQAVEIAQLNLLLKIAEKGHRLPLLQQNIQNGNSLIDDPAIAGDKAFKWEERFKDIMQEGGFDVIIGNPPYVRQEEIKEMKLFFKNKFPEVFSGTADLYVYFFARGLSVLKEGGYFAFIVSNKFIKSGYGKNLREYISKNFEIVKYFDNFKDKVFKDANVDPCIIILKKEKPTVKHKILYNDEEEILQSTLSLEGWSFGTKKLLKLKDKIESIGTKIKYLKSVKILRGVVTGLTEAFIIDNKTKSYLVANEPKSKNLIKPFIRGRDIKRYNIKNPNLYLLLVENGIKLEDDSPLVYKHLLNFKNKLEKRWDKGSRWYNLRPCIYYNEFDKPKIVYPDISENGGFSYDTENYFFNNTVYMITGSIKKYWVSLLNSKLLSWYYKQIASNLGKKGVRYFTQFVENIPLVEIDKKNEIIIDGLLNKMLSLNNRLNEIGDKKTDERARIEEEIKKTEAEIDELVYKLYSITEEEKKIIEESLK